MSHDNSDQVWEAFMDLAQENGMSQEQMESFSFEQVLEYVEPLGIVDYDPEYYEEEVEMQQQVVLSAAIKIIERGSDGRSPSRTVLGT